MTTETKVKKANTTKGFVIQKSGAGETLYYIDGEGWTRREADATRYDTYSAAQKEVADYKLGTTKVIRVH